MIKDPKLFKDRIVIGLSGGVDSAVAAYLLLQEGYDVQAVFMQNWDSVINQENNNANLQCISSQDYFDAQKIAAKLNIKLHKVDFIDQYWNEVFQYLLIQYKAGLTPNPDIMCNNKIKFLAFKKYCQEKLDCSKIATGHYVAIETINSRVMLKIPADVKKDQTYFLANLQAEQLSNCVFPLANLSKEAVRKLAAEIGLEVATKKDSTGICFIGKKNFKTFLQNYFPVQPGNIIDVDQNKILGHHDGYFFYTLGQRKGVNISGQNKPYYIIAKNATTNTIFVTNNTTSKFLSINKIITTELQWMHPENITYPLHCQIRYRHTQELINAVVTKKKNNQFCITLEKLSAITSPGQYIAIYQNNICLGSGPIHEIYHDALQCGYYQAH